LVWGIHVGLPYVRIVYGNGVEMAPGHMQS
jgi:hypothetical protein